MKVFVEQPLALPGSANSICPVNAGPGEPVILPELDIALSLGQACSSCPEGHQLELSGEDKGGWTCDVCGEGRSEEGWRCEEDKRLGRGGECDYDVCSGCRQEYKVSGGGREEVRVYSRLTLYQT